MAVNICLLTSTLDYPKGAGILWVYLNWALGFRGAGCRISWVELVNREWPLHKIEQSFHTLSDYLKTFWVCESPGLLATDGQPLPGRLQRHAIDLETLAAADLVVNFFYAMPSDVLQHCRRTALIDIDPGLLQTWVSNGDFELGRHDVYFSIGETVGRPDALFSDCGLRWLHTPPAVYLPEWPVKVAANDAAFTTVVHFWYGEMRLNNETIANDKRVSFLQCLDLPRLAKAKLELAICLGEDGDAEERLWTQNGWRVRRSWSVSSTPFAYREYIQGSRGEFSCVKPSCIRLQNAWVSDRTICYLATGKPAVIQHTGPSRLLPEAEGVFRFRTPTEAALALNAIENNYSKHCRAARALAEEHFDAVKVAKSLLDRAF
jgi:hypothetical protein